MITIKRISILGRVAIGIECLELMIEPKYKTEVFDFITSFLWEFVENENIVIVDWEEISAEITPDSILNTPYSDTDFELIGEEKYNNLSIFYSKIGKDCCMVIDKIVDIASLHFYTIIPSYSSETYKLTKEVLSLCEDKIGYIPNMRIRS